LPCKDYFIWGDDTEYTRRLSTYYGEGYLVGESIAIHKRALAKDLVIDNETNPIRIDMFHYLYRNRAIIRHYYDNSYHLFFEFCKSILNGLIHLKRKNGCRMARAIIRGQVESIFQYRHFKEYMDGQIQINT
jgi:GT2 family glycosyltransferase